MPTYKVGDKIVKNSNSWKVTEFDSWGRGVGIGTVIEIIDTDTVDVRWSGGICYEHIDQIKKYIPNKGKENE